MRILRYTITKEPCVSLSLPQFTRLVKSVLQPSQWRGHQFVHVTSGVPDFRIILTSPRTVYRTCGFRGLSCANIRTKYIYINSNRYARGSKRSGMSLADYRVYVINHEVGHILGKGHAVCPCKTKRCNELAPVMNQATLGNGHCKPNNSPLQYEQLF